MLRDCLSSLKKLDYPNYEIIVVDAASTDGTPEMIASEFPDVILIEGKRRLGVGEAINLGIGRSKGEIIAFDLNNDEVFSKNWLKFLVKEVRSTEAKKVVGGTRLIYGRDGIIDSAGARIDFLGRETIIDGGQKISEIPLKTKEVDYVGCPVFHIKLLDKMRSSDDTIELCDEKYHFYCEDSDFCERARKMGYKVINVYSAISYHRRSATMEAQSAKSYYYLRRNKLRFIIKHYSIFRLFVASIWWSLTVFSDAIRFFPLTQKFLLYAGLQKMSYEPMGQTLIDLVYWNIRNIKDHFRARMREMAIP